MTRNHLSLCPTSPFQPSYIIDSLCLVVLGMPEVEGQAASRVIAEQDFLKHWQRCQHAKLILKSLLFERWRYKHKHVDNKDFHLPVNLQMPTTTVSGLGWSQGLRTQYKPSIWMLGTQVLEPSPTASQDIYWLEAGIQKQNWHWNLGVWYVMWAPQTASYSVWKMPTPSTQRLKPGLQSNVMYGWFLFVCFPMANPWMQCGIQSLVNQLCFSHKSAWVTHCLTLSFLICMPERVRMPNSQVLLKKWFRQHGIQRTSSIN